MKKKFDIKTLKFKGSRLRRSIPFLVTSAFLLFCSGGISAADKLELSLAEAINISIKENLSLSQERLYTKISEGDIKFREGEFDPAIELKASESYKKSPAPSILTGTDERITDGGVSLGGKVNTGTSYELRWMNERVRSNLGFLTINPYYTSELVLTMTQPLLKGIGKDVQEANLNVARNNLEAAGLNLDDKTAKLIADTSKAYWNLAFARHDLDVAALSLKLAQNLLDEIKARIDAGVLAPVEIYKAEAETSLREENLLRAKKLVKDAEDNLRVVMNLKDWNVEIIPVEKTPLPGGIQPVETSVETALGKRKDYKQALIDRKNKEILRNYFDNQKNPDLSITGSAGLNGLNGTYGNSLDRLSSRDYYSWQFGVSLKIPIGNRTAEGNYAKAKAEEEKAELALKILEQKITAEVREAWRALQLAFESINAAKKTRTAAQKRLEAEEGRFKVGMATVNDVFKFQEEYAKALSSEKKAETDYAKAIVELEKTKGTLGH